MKKAGEAEIFKLLCGLTPLPLAKPSSITPDGGPLCQCTFTQKISWWTRRGDEGAQPASHSRAPCSMQKGLLSPRVQPMCRKMLLPPTMALAQLAEDMYEAESKERAPREQPSGG